MDHSDHVCFSLDELDAVSPDTSVLLDSIEDHLDHVVLFKAAELVVEATIEAVAEVVSVSLVVVVPPVTDSFVVELVAVVAVVVGEV